MSYNNSNSKTFRQKYAWSSFKKSEFFTRRKVSRGRSTQPASKVCFNLVKDLFEEGRISQGKRSDFRSSIMLNRHWKEICGELLFRHLRPGGVSRQTLMIEASSGIWVEQARFIEGNLKQRIQKFVPGLKFRTIKFKVGSFKSLKEVEESQKGNETDLDNRMQKAYEEALRREKKV